MSFGTMEQYFECMGRTMEFRYILPDDPRFKMNFDGTENPAYKRPTKLVICLHGYTHDNLEWIMNTRVWDLAIKYNVAFFFPNGENGFWVNHGGCKDRMGDFVGNDLLEYVCDRFALSKEKKDHFVFGISMGGFGSLHTGLAYADNYSKIASFSPALVLYEMEGADKSFENAGGDYSYYMRVFGHVEDVLESEQNPEVLIKKLKAAKKEIPGIFHCCGTEDFLLEHNRRFERFLDDEKIEHVYLESAGMHDYNFWNQYTEKALLWALEEESNSKVTTGLIV